MEEQRSKAAAREYNWLYQVIAAAASFLACSFISGFEFVCAIAAVCVSTYLYTLKRSPFSLLGLILGGGAALGYHFALSPEKVIQRLVHSLFDDPVEIVTSPLIGCVITLVTMILFCVATAELMLRGSRRSFCVATGAFIGSLGIFLNAASMFYIKYHSLSAELFKEKLQLLLRYVREIYIFTLGEGKNINQELLEAQAENLVFTVPASVVLLVFLSAYLVSVIIKKLGVKSGSCAKEAWEFLPSKESALMCVILFVLSFATVFSDPDGVAYYGLQMLLTPLRAAFFIVGVQRFILLRRQKRNMGMPGSGIGTVILIAMAVLFFDFVSIFVTVMGMVAAFRQKTEKADKK